MNLHVLAQEYARAVLRDPGQFLKRAPARDCPVCGFEGRFLSVGPRPEARCPNCSSKERDRIMGLYLEREGIVMEGQRVLHFSAERPFFRQWKHNPDYVAGDVKRSSVANAVVDIRALQYPDNHFDRVICHHVLEHVVEDEIGMRECFRVLKPGGYAFFSVPLDSQRETTWEPPEGMPTEEIERICGRYHVRLYGRDFTDKLAQAGFRIEPVSFTPEEGERHRLTERHSGPLQGLDQIFVGRKD